MVLDAKPKAGKVVKPLALPKSYSCGGNSESTLFNEANWGVVTQKYMGIIDNRLWASSFTKVIQMTSDIIKKTTGQGSASKSTTDEAMEAENDPYSQVIDESDSEPEADDELECVSQ